MRRIRTTDDHTVYFETCEPAEDEVIRVRHTINHAIKDLDSAAATTVPTHHARLIGLLAAAYACTVRARQISENPAIPRDALDALAQTAQALELAAYGQLRRIHDQDGPAWSSLGL